MNKPPLSLVALLAIAPLFAGGCTLYSNPRACKAQMRQLAADALPTEQLSISHVGVGIDGSRVVVEGKLETADAPTGASDTAAPHRKAQTVAKAAAVECTFDGNKLTALHWLQPPEIANATATADSER